ncbi:MAG: heme lyase NrfEFG subunit NrfE, partial [bacterium]|nr:heme lyase NrfEFG subunit NrfE [bacterium]
MIAELGLFSLILALIASVLLAIIPLMGLQLKRVEWMNAAPVYVVSQFCFITFSYLCLTLCFLNDDFSVVYVVSNSSLLLPWFYKLCAVWGGHEGSMLLWVAILSLWMILVCFFSRALDLEMRTRVLVILGWLSIGFILFLLITSNPFLRQF